MESLIINPQTSKMKNYTLAFVGLYFLLFCGYLVFSEAAIERYYAMFFFAAIGMFVALALFLVNTLWISNKALLKIDNVTIESNIKGSKFKIEWVQVSKVEMTEYDIIFYTDGGRKERRMNLSNILYKEIFPIRNKIEELCEHKNISLSK